MINWVWLITAFMIGWIGGVLFMAWKYSSFVYKKYKPKDRDDE